MFSDHPSTQQRLIHFLAAFTSPASLQQCVSEQTPEDHLRCGKILDLVWGYCSTQIWSSLLIFAATINMIRQIKPDILKRFRLVPDLKSGSAGAEGTISVLSSEG